ncbi:hypothetical protein CONCODRAFT_85440 [Conidiobolus coronatus NRRL 28638]|uniref:Uncharacterized protein n=1 Tax=Conidiobolus coronatus (strain ATCC 28846 / CBS 209.66 / NRRL 28638) TaxID=796925 RepID=A0A137P5F3_CONC2|nr:hypothetical protein CONCODRAFT_85440 [Conidiobolus coronatus NRRL 28638]|eukprot:KXN70235.1 hypothetical protein CONCODRAFT_85440 [Conidiobolus coronatus NRRL 28638]
MLSTRKPKVIATNIITPNSNSNSNSQDSSNTLPINRPTHLSKRSISSNVTPTIGSVSPQNIARSTTATPNSVTSNGHAKTMSQPKARISNPQNIIRSATNTIIAAARFNGGGGSNSTPSTMIRRGPKSEIGTANTSGTNANSSPRSLLFSPPPPSAFPTIQPDDLVSNVSSASDKSDNNTVSEPSTALSTEEDEAEEEGSTTSESSQSTNENSEFQEARTNRRILDLEISNKSLLLVNTNLEQKLKKQAELIENLKKELILVNNSKKVEILKVEELEVKGEENGQVMDSNTQFNRLFSICDRLVLDGERALMEDIKSSGTKVISILPPELDSDESNPGSDSEEGVMIEEGYSERVKPAQLTPCPEELTFTSIDTSALRDEVD